MNIYLNSYHPLCEKEIGQKRAARQKNPPFVDSSCRREPDFESARPSITSLCRAGRFARKLQEGDVVVYITVQGRHAGSVVPHWRLVAILQVMKRLESHPDAARWYKEHGYRLPSNCMVKGNPPLERSRTVYKNSGCNAVGDAERKYKKRADTYGTFLVCEALYMELDDPPIISRHMMEEVFGTIPGTQNPRNIEPSEYQALVKILGIRKKVRRMAVAA